MRGRPQPYLGLVTFAATTDLCCDVTTISPSADDLITARLDTSPSQTYIYTPPGRLRTEIFLSNDTYSCFPTTATPTSNTLTPAVMTRTEVSFGRSTVLRGWDVL